MTMEISSVGERLVKVTLTGRLDTSGVDRVETRFVAALVPGGNSAIVDLSHVEFVSSMGIRMLISAARSLRTREASLVIYGAPTAINQIFETVSLQEIIPIRSTEAEALAAVASSN